MNDQKEFKNLKIKQEDAVDGLFFSNSEEDKEDAVLEPGMASGKFSSVLDASPPVEMEVTA